MRYPKKLSDRCKLLEKEDCLLGDNCFEYFLSWTNWGSCVLPSDRQCGIGQRRSYSQCVRNDGVIVNRKYCQDVSISYKYILICLLHLLLHYKAKTAGRLVPYITCGPVVVILWITLM